MTIILTGTIIDACKAAKDLRENQCISSDVILMFDDTTEKLLHDDLSDVNSIRLDNVAGNIAPKAVDEFNYCCVNKLKTENIASASEYKLKLSLIIYYL